MALSFEDGMRALGKLLESQLNPASKEVQGGISSSEKTVIESTSSGTNTMPVGTNHSGFDINSYNPLSGPASIFDTLYASLGAADDEDEDDERTETDYGVLSNQLMPVTLEKEKKTEFNKYFFDRKSTRQFPLLYMEVARLSAGISGFFALLRYILNDARHLTTLEPKERAQVINEAAQTIYDRVATLDLKEPVVNALEETASGSGHVIRPSRRFKGGYDFDMLGQLAASDGVYDAVKIKSVFVPYKEHHVSDISEYGHDSDGYYKSQQLEAYAIPLSQAVIKVGQQVTEMLCGGDANSVGKVTQRTVKHLPLAYDFKKLNDIFFDHTGIVLTVDFMNNIGKGFVSHNQNFTSLLCVRTPKDSFVNLVQRRKRQISSDTELENAQNGTNNAPLPVDMDSFLADRVRPEGLAVSQNISFSISISLDEDYTRYVSQTEPGQAIPMLSLHNWMSMWSRNVLRPKHSRVSGGRTKLNRLPRVIVPLSKAQGITELRAKNKLAIEKGKVNADNLFVAGDGSLQYGLPADAAEIASKTVAAYESDMEAYLQYCYENGIPIQTGTTLPTALLAATGEHAKSDEFSSLTTAIKKYSGKLLAFNWDYNTIITANVANPTYMVPKDTVGSSKVNDLILADYLGMNFAEPGEEPIQTSFAEALVMMQNYSLRKPTTNDPGQSPMDVIGNPSDPARFLGAPGEEKDSFAAKLLEYYKFLLYKGLVPKQEDLIAEAARELGLDPNSPLEETQEIVSSLVIDWFNKAPQSSYKGPYNIVKFLAECLRSVMQYASGSALLRQKISLENPGVDSRTLSTLVQESDETFYPHMTCADFGRLYKKLPGMIWKLACQHIVDIEPSVAFSAYEDMLDEGMNKISQPSYSNLTGQILPLATLFARYIPKADEIMERAEQIRDGIKCDPSINESDIKISGGNATSQMFPHQVDSHRCLRTRPEFAILDIAPGGGKTTIGVTDIASMVTELHELGENNIRPLILCPDNLIKNWVDDMKIFTDNKWNMIPLNGRIMKRWDYDELDEIISNAPVNTIVVAGFHFLSSRVESINIGTYQIRVSNNLEFLKRYGFDYICIDESHKLKNKSSSRHKAVKQLTTGSHVRYLRLASGTLISNVVSDIVGQTALYNSHIFRDGEVAGGKKSKVSKDSVHHWKVATPDRARKKLSQFANVITKKKKEWAFMLPSPIEHFHAISMVPSREEGATEREVELGELHQQLYDTVLKETEEELEALVEKIKNVRGEDDDDDDDDADDGDSGDGDGDDDNPLDLGLDSNDEFAGISQEKLKPYLQRIERLITNPMRDPAFEDVFGPAGVTTYHSAKARFVANLIAKHFDPPVWEKGKHYKEYTYLTYKGKYYLSRKLETSTATPVLLPDTTIGVSPDVDTETWKEEPEGKVIVFCRYTNSVVGIYDALPEEYRSIAVMYTGEEDDKLLNLDAFLNDFRVKILIANEQGIAEGHNMQIASRIIRIESPWAPGDLEQSESRIFRPDPKAAKEMVTNGKPGELYREAIFLDWVLADNSMEVQKQARLISKIVQNASFDESENPLYTEVLEDYSELETVSMGMKLLRSRSSLRDYHQHVMGYSAFKNIQREEFQNMRVHGDSTMRDLDAHPEVPGSKKIRTPFVAGQKPNEDGMKLVTLRNLLRNPEHISLLSNLEKLKTLPVITDHGPGRIASFIVRHKKKAVLDEDGNPKRGDTRKGKGTGKIEKTYWLDENGKRRVDADNPISSIRVISSETQKVLPRISDIGAIFVVLDELKGADKKKFHVNSFNVTKTDERRSKREEERLKREQEREERAEEERLIKEERQRREAEKRSREKLAAQENAKKRKRNLDEGKPINEGIPEVTRIPKPGQADYIPGQAIKDPETTIVTLYPELVHGFLTLEMVSKDPDEKLYKKMEFKNTGSYAYLDIKYFRHFDLVFNYLEDNFSIPNNYYALLEEVQDAFDSDANKGIYRLEMAPTSELPYFFASMKRITRDPNTIRPFPIVYPSFLRIAVDIKSNPAIRDHIGKRVPRANAKWQQSEGHYLFFTQSKRDMRAKVNELKRAGFTITNEKKLMENINAIKFRAPRGSRK